jgi:hypothetical protein
VSQISLTAFCALGLVIVTSWATRHAIGGGQRFSASVRKSVLALAEPVLIRCDFKFFNHNYPTVKIIQNNLKTKDQSKPKNQIKIRS